MSRSESSLPTSATASDLRDAAVELLIAGRSGPSFLLDRAADNMLGRSTEALVVLPDRLASRLHAALRYDAAADEWQLRDLASRNGTWLDGVRITSAAVGDGSVIRVGTSELVFRLVAAAEGPPRSADGLQIVRSGPVGQLEGQALKRSAATHDGVRWPLLLYQAGIRLLSARGIRDVIGTTLELAAEHSGAASFGWFHHASDRFEPVCVVPPGCGLLELLTHDPVRRLIDKGQAVWFQASFSDVPATTAWHEIACIPLLERQRGEAVLAAAAPAGVLRDADFDFLVALASLASAACAGRLEADQVAAEVLDDGSSLHTVPLDAPERTLALTAEAAAELLASEPRSPAAEELAGFRVGEAGSLKLADWQRALVIEALRRSGGSVPNAAAELGISRATLYRKLEAYGLTRARG